ncbi:MAG: hypothetical protein ABII68_11990 [Pseudomonadota bacterium]
MSKIDEIKAAIESLPEKDFVQLRRWLSEKDWENWDRQMGAHSEHGRLDFLIREALEEKNEGKLRDL